MSTLSSCCLQDPILLWLAPARWPFLPPQVSCWVFHFCPESSLREHPKLSQSLVIFSTSLASLLPSCNLTCVNLVCTSLSLKAISPLCNTNSTAISNGPTYSLQLCKEQNLQSKTAYSHLGTHPSLPHSNQRQWLRTKSSWRSLVFLPLPVTYPKQNPLANP